MRIPATARWLGLALLGILIAAGISIAASHLASQQIGLASEPISAGDALAPAAREKEGAPSPQSPSGSRPTPRPRPSNQSTLPAAPPTTESSPPAQVDDSSSPGGDGEHGGGGADD
jgi:hypothetical protein